MNQEEIEHALADLENWGSNGKEISCRFSFSNFVESLEFVNKVGEMAEATNHHPDIEFGWGYALIKLTTHDAGGLTTRDFSLAHQIDNLCSAEDYCITD